MCTAFVGEPMKRGEKRSRTNEKDTASDLFNAVGDANAVQRIELQGSENQEVEGARQDIGWFGHMPIISIGDIDCQCLFSLSLDYRELELGVPEFNLTHHAR
jgi:hypothetical protein